MNSIYFGDGYEGVGRCQRQGYFGKAPCAPDRLTNATLLAGIPNAPSRLRAPRRTPIWRASGSAKCSKKLVAYDYLVASRTPSRIGAQYAA